MAGALQRDPQLAGKWRVDDVEAAVSFDEMLQAVDAPPMAPS